MASRRLARIQHELAPAPTSIGSLTFGDITVDLPTSVTPSRLPHLQPLDINDAGVRDDLHWMLQKFLLGQDIFLLGQPGPYARKLVMTFCSMINAEYEHVALHRDIGETELKQGREIRAGGALEYVDSGAVRAVKHGRILILEGVERAERGILPLLNNLLENREMNLEDGTYIMHSHRHALLAPDVVKRESMFVSAHDRFRVIAIAAPVPPNTGYPLDPPFRSRFQARFVNPARALLALAPPSPDSVTRNDPASHLEATLRELILTTQYASQPSALDVLAASSLPPFPQIALARLFTLIHAFPPPRSLNPTQLARLLIALHPRLLVAPLAAWALLSERCEAAGLGPLGSPTFSEEDTQAADIAFCGYIAHKIERSGDQRVRITFVFGDNERTIVHEVPAGPYPLVPFPPSPTASFIPSPRFLGLLSAVLQSHAVSYDFSLLPSPSPGTASSSTSTLQRVLASILGYGATESMHLYKELGGRELLMRRVVGTGGATSWEASRLVKGAWDGSLVCLEGVDVLGPTAGVLARLAQDREIELWEGRRIVATSGSNEPEKTEDGLSYAHPAFRMITSASGSVPLRDWLTEEHANTFFPVPLVPMSRAEESTALRAAAPSCPTSALDKLLDFAARYRSSLSTDGDAAGFRKRKLGTRALVRIARRVSLVGEEEGGKEMYGLIGRALLKEFLPATEKMALEDMLADCGISPSAPTRYPAPILTDTGLLFPAPSSASGDLSPLSLPFYPATADPEGASSFVPHMTHFFDNSLQTSLLRDLGVDLCILNEHLVLLGNQGVGKNKLVDRLCQLLRRPREYVQLHRDTTVQSLLFNTTLTGGVIKHEDSPLLRAVKLGRVIVVDEADKAPEHVVAVFKSLAGSGELSLPDGRRVRKKDDGLGRRGDIEVHADFRLILLANRPGYPFLGNHFLQVLGDNFSLQSVANPDLDSELRLLAQLAPELGDDTLRRLVGAFQDLRKGYDEGTLTYPYSLRELIAIVRHMRAYANDDLDDALRNVFDFDAFRPDAMDKLADILRHHGLRVQRLNQEETSSTKRPLDMKFEPKKTELGKPKFGKEDPNNEPHEGGNTWAGGTGGRDTAGMGGRGGYMRLYKGNDIKQVSDELKRQVPDETRERAREMAKAELARRLEELNMSAGEAKEYAGLLTAVQAHIAGLLDLLENLAAKEEERVWVKRQTDGELDDSRLTEGLTGETTVYKRRGMAKPELGRPQIKPKRLRFLFDLSGSMYRFQYDGRLQRSLETAVMLMETFNRLSRKDKFAWDSGDSPDIPLVRIGESIAEVNDRWRVVKKMDMVPQYAFAGDHTVEALEKAAADVARFDGDEHFVVAITDANFSRYGITAEDLRRAMNKHPKVKIALICIGEGAEAAWVPKQFPGRAFRVAHTADIPKVLRGILTSMIDK
ncbi:hypothetical protein PENSPDRAFT_674901 [Peniophora sp. CONT]|nr:hypothetical protein PENSPDRAFT_674901 [Peniophora sp. CONT]